MADGETVALSQGTVSERQPHLPALAALRGGRRPAGCRAWVGTNDMAPPAWRPRAGAGQRCSEVELGIMTFNNLCALSVLGGGV